MGAKAGGKIDSVLFVSVRVCAQFWNAQGSPGQTHIQSRPSRPAGWRRPRTRKRSRVGARPDGAQNQRGPAWGRSEAVARNGKVLRATPKSVLVRAAYPHENIPGVVECFQTPLLSCCPKGHAILIPALGSRAWRSDDAAPVTDLIPLQLSGCKTAGTLQRNSSASSTFKIGTPQGGSPSPPPLRPHLSR